MKETTGIRRFRIAVALIAVLLIAVMAAMNFPLLQKPFEALFARRISFEQMTEDVVAQYKSNKLWGKYESITLNGLFARLTGRRAYNEVTLMKNGMLTETVKTNRQLNLSAIERASHRICSLDAYLKDLGIPFLFVAAPNKVPLDDSLLPDGTHSTRNPTAQRVVGLLDEAGVDTLNLIPLLVDSREHIEKYYYRTDHHWNPDGSFTAYGRILEAMEDALGTALNRESADPALWERHVKRDWWLGSRGKRVGPLFVGIDDLIWYTPNFETDMSRAVPSSNTWCSGDFADACLVQKSIETRNLYKTDNHHVFMGGNVPTVALRNRSAANPLKVMLIQDSYGKSTAAFLGAAFSEVNLLDPRHYVESSVAQFIDWTRPDIVVLMVNSGNVTSDDFIVDFGVEAQQAWRRQHVGLMEALHSDRISVAAGEDDDWSQPLKAALDPGGVFHIDIGDVAVTAGDAEAFSVLVYEKTGQKVVNGTIFDIDYCRSSGGFHWAFQVPADGAEYELRLCPGVYGQSADRALELIDLTLSRE